jgi:hypothetical protein
MARKVHSLDMDDLIRRYVEGQESSGEIARSIGIPLSTLSARFRVAGVIRSSSEENLRRYSKMSAAERAAATEAAHTAARGRKRSPEEIHKMALTRQRRRTVLGQGEVCLGRWLEARGLNTALQAAVGPYNIDIAIFPVAVELLINGHLPSRHKDIRKIEYLMDRGISVIYVQVPRLALLTEAAADYIVSFFEEVHCSPSEVGEYRVIRGTGEVLAAGRGKFENFARVRSARSQPDMVRGPDGRFLHKAVRVL